MQQNENNILIYQDDNGITKVNVRFSDGELEDCSATHKDFLLVCQEGKRNVQRNIAHYNLDVIIALGYRVQSQLATRFRRWARFPYSKIGRFFGVQLQIIR